MVKKVALTALMVAMVFCAAANADDAGQLKEALRTVRLALASRNASAEQRHDNYARLARLLRLQGDVEGSAAAWQNAASALPNRRDNAALLESAACYMAMGEWEKAGDNITLALKAVHKHDNRALYLRARYLEAQLEAFSSGKCSLLLGLVKDVDFRAALPAIYFTLWRISKDGHYRAMLIDKFPESPEGRAVVGDEVRSADCSAWFLFPGRDGAQ
jgi:tetratricopeptide (TPR) repeat protein